ncbi:MAG: S-layer protein, partial [Candidatus Diapherotrites archaeon]|nr:S-layer protein [Candidatus Diapherotrites archaeon]
KIVVGNPDPHGEFKARARDNYLAADLTAFLASIASEITLPVVFLDTSIPSIEKENSNLIIVGGIVTNKLALEVNNLLPLKFVSHGGHWIIKSSLSGKEYSEDSIGVVQKIPHPKFKDKSILVIAGNRSQGTKAGILAFAKNLHEIVKGNSFGKEFFAHIVEGLDLDADGEIDSVEVKE